MVQIVADIPLSDKTAFAVGGRASNYCPLKTSVDLKAVLTHLNPDWPVWVLGAGTNCLISDRGLPGLTIHFTDGDFQLGPRHQIIADAGVIWDDLVVASIEQGLWGIELLSGIPGTVGAAATININAYGQALTDSLDWVEVYDKTGQSNRISYQPQDWGYKKSPFSPAAKQLSTVGLNRIVGRIGLTLQTKPTTDLAYQAALDIAHQRGLDPRILTDRRQIIIEARHQAGSLLWPNQTGQAKTCGSFFKNPTVKRSLVKKLIDFDESQRTRRQLRKMNQLGSGSRSRVSAAHVLLAAGFKRGQQFGQVRLHPDHVLKLENYRQASAAELADVARLIQITVRKKLGINLEPEVVFLGRFDTTQST